MCGKLAGSLFQHTEELKNKPFIITFVLKLVRGLMSPFLLVRILSQLWRQNSNLT